MSPTYDLLNSSIAQKNTKRRNRITLKWKEKSFIKSRFLLILCRRETWIK